MNRVKRAVHAADTLQQRHAWLAVPVAVWKKFGDDQAGYQAALITYYSFVAIFPLLLELVTVLNIVLKNDPGLQHRLLNSALSHYPVIGQQLGHISPLTQTGLPLVVGLLAWLYLEAELTLYAVQINVVTEYRLWPRAIAPPPYTEQDRQAFQLYTQVEERSKDPEGNTDRQKTSG